ncbi:MULTISPECIES: L,D-transpeptidase family protein [Methylotenera]|uniref:L,D-transpeptidase family protein n=1 Tax=Methylotenera TaxID=359407 RepID=UPI00036AB6C7|nr:MULTISPECIES: L,D-transpeptidase family protein [Methylotenera]
MVINLKLKFLKIIAVVCCAILPWNATAVNHGSMADLLLNQKFGKSLVESLLVKSLLEITQGNTKQAFATINELICTAPNFKLAYLIRGDLLSAQGRGLESLGNANLALASKTNSDQIEGLRQEARTRIDYYLSDKKNHQIPNLLVKLSPEQTHVIVVDTVKSRLYVYKNADNKLQYVADYYVTIGKNGAGKQAQGDKRTPLGVYFAGKKLTQPLADMYGSGAYPLNYPNELDQHQNKNGYGIWLHGTPTNTYSRPPRASDGCVVLSNPDLSSLAPILQTGKVPVIISDNIEWLNPTKSDFQSNEQKSLSESIEDWRKDWVSQNADKYLSHYSEQFFYSDGNYQKWADYKRVVQSAKPKVSINIDKVSMFSYPNLKENIVVVNFEQDFKSATLQNKMLKRQYWINQNNQWKIIYEGAI